MHFDVDGHAIDYEVRGEGRAIILIHGLTTDRRLLIEACEPVLAATPGLRRIYLDLPGHGASKGNPARAGADAMVEALAAFVREVGGERPLVLGYAWGAYLAQGLVRDLDLGGVCLLCPVVEADFGKRFTPPRHVAGRDPELPFSDDAREREAFLEVAVVQSRAVLERFQRGVHPANTGLDHRSGHGTDRIFSQGAGEQRESEGIAEDRKEHFPPASLFSLRSPCESDPGGRNDDRGPISSQRATALRPRDPSTQVLLATRPTW